MSFQFHQPPKKNMIKRPPGLISPAMTLKKEVQFKVLHAYFVIMHNICHPLNHLIFCIRELGRNIDQTPDFDLLVPMTAILFLQNEMIFKG